jgi:hypothetical protein
MKKTSLLLVLFLCVGTTVIFAEENIIAFDRGVQNYASRSTNSSNRNTPTFELAGRGFMNLALGIGSFTQGDVGGGITLLLGYAAAAALIIVELGLDYEDPLAGYFGDIGLGVAGVTAVYGFVRPFTYYNRTKSRTAGIFDGMNIAVVPDNRGVKTVALSYTINY